MQKTQNIENRGQRKRGVRAFLFSTFHSLSSNRGFTLLFAVLIASVLLAIGIAIFNITVRELRLSSVVRDSEKAIYASDAGAECGLYNTFKMNNFSPTTTSTWVCNGQTFSNIGGHGLGDPSNADPNATSTIQIMYGTQCAYVSVGQTTINPSSGGQIRTIIESHGYNPCDPTSASRLERVYRIVF